MFIISLTYKQSNAEVDKYIDSHRIFLTKFYAAGVFIMSGRKQPRTGGIILAKAQNLASLEQIIQQDPFYIHQLADYEITEFLPSKSISELSHLLLER
ncbi:YciI family protein [Catenovulum maritimum]|uniref:GTP cyclohydrolase n=1 Tax=Catenovulum maritimum TaxID=1513271 RepID=A0A0J8GSY6_9ALTE|nr:YciI family protein [Catenovulum maritimum]KMT65867.1 GTP cyclohydrolase [Catenovulum maritimum]